MVSSAFIQKRSYMWSHLILKHNIGEISHKYCLTSRIMIEKASNQRETDKLSLQNGWIFAFILMSQQSKKHLTNSKTMDPTTVYGHPERAFFQKFENFGLGQTNWAEVLWGILGISGQIISTILALWVLCSWENVACSISNKKLWFLGLEHIHCITQYYAHQGIF